MDREALCPVQEFATLSTDQGSGPASTAEQSGGLPIPSSNVKKKIQVGRFLSSVRCKYIGVCVMCKGVQDRHHK